MFHHSSAVISEKEKESIFGRPCLLPATVYYASENGSPPPHPDERPPSSAVSNPLSTFLPSLQLLS